MHVTKKVKIMHKNTTKSKISKDLNYYQVHVVSWNVGQHFPDNISLREILDLQYSEIQQFPDIYAIGFQEINTQPQQQIFAIFKEDPWIIKIKELLGSLDYVLMKSVQMQGLQLSIYVRRIHVPYLHDIEAIYTRTGFGGIWGNKGAVSIRLCFYGITLVFVNAHLAAHDDRLDERIQHFQQIIKNHRFSLEAYKEIYDHDYVFWFGDLNFRLSSDISFAEVFEKINNDKLLLDLLKHDQLTRVRNVTCEAFYGLNEGKIYFPPTFKYKDGTSEYDLKRRPAWTDRILYGVQPSKSKPNKALEIKQCTYTSHPTYCISDHKPVSALFQIILCPPVYQEAFIKFDHITTWSIGEEQTVKYSKSSSFQVGSHDWIGIFHKNYISLRDYIAYEYVNEMPTSPGIDIDPHFANSYYGSHYPHNSKEHSAQREYSTHTLNFMYNVKLQNGEEYILMYFHNPGTPDITSIAGISGAFCAEKQISLKNFVNID